MSETDVKAIITYICRPLSSFCGDAGLIRLELIYQFEYLPVEGRPFTFTFT